MAGRIHVCSTTPIHILLVVVILASAYIPRSTADCPPLGLVTHDDYLVDVGFHYWEPTVGIDECGRFIVAYWARVQNFDEFWSADLVLAKRYLPDGSPWDTVPFSIRFVNEASGEKEGTPRLRPHSRVGRAAAGARILSRTLSPRESLPVCMSLY